MTIRRASLLMPVAILVLAGCTGGDTADQAARADSVTQRQRDSVIGESNLPGASGVRGALDASDAAAERAATIDSLSGGG
jgi:outer membrane biogenesis lipoprotein LolB